MNKKQYYVYIMTNKINTVLYTGVTNNLLRRVYEHKQKVSSSFTAKYNVNKLIYYEACDDIRGAIEAEKKIKAGSRRKKIELIKKMNLSFKDLSDGLIG